MVAVGVVWGTVQIANADQGLGAAPLVGRWSWNPDGRLMGAALFAVVVIVFGPRLARTASWRAVLLGAGTAAAVWSALLAAGDGWATPFARRSDYLGTAVAIDSPLEFLRTFTERAGSYPVHVKGHPPGATLVFWVLDWMGLTGSGWAGLVVLVAWAVAATSVLIALAHVAGRPAARRAAPFVALAPAAVWAGFSADAFFAGIIAVGITLVIAATAHPGHRGRWLAAGGGVVLGVSLHLTYGAVPLLLIPAVVVARRRRYDLVPSVAVGALIVTGIFVAAGFWWLDGLALTHEQYWTGVASRRPWPYYLLAGNPAALALAVGPGLAVGLSRVRRTRTNTWLVAATALAAVAVANLSGMSKGEVERIWLPFFPWILTATAPIPASRQRTWLAANAGLGLVLQVILRSPW